MDLNELNRSTIIICNNSYRKQLLKQLNDINKLIDIKFMSIDEFIKRYTYNYDEKTIYYLMNKYHMKYDVAISYIKNTYYIEDKHYESSKLTKLVELKKELKENNLLIQDIYFKDYIKNKDILIYNLSLNKYQLSILNNISNIKIIEKKYYDYLPHIYEFTNIEEEIEFIAIKICELINNGININNIKLTNISSDYNNALLKIFSFYNLKVNLRSEESIYSTNIVNEFLNIKENSIIKKIEILNQKYQLNDNEIYNQLITICNKYTWNDKFDEVKDLIIQDLKTTKIKLSKYQNMIDIIDYKNDYIDDSEYVFMLNFNQGSIPIIYKDEDFITDNLKDDLLLETTYIKNKIEKVLTIKNIRNIKNLIITYKLKTPFQSYYKSNLIDEFNLDVEKNKINYETVYSNISTKINLTKYLDNFIKYGTYNENINLLFNNYKNINYLTYNHKFKGIDKNTLYQYLNNKLYLSYSSMDNYYRCQFRYYLSNILKIDLYEETFSILIGNIFHHILQISLEKIVDVRGEVNKYLILNNIKLNNKERFFLNKLVEELIFIIDTIKKQMHNCHLDKTLYEEQITITKDETIKTVFIGYIDKLLYKKYSDNTIVALIDYKTGNTDIELKNIPYGIGMQLPVYLYLASKSKQIDNIKFAGFYLQKILNNEITIDKNKTYEQQKINNLKLVGYSNSNINILKEFDDTYENSFTISSMKTNNDGSFSSYAKVLNNEQINNIINIVDKKIDEAIKNILEAKFDINPKKIGYGINSNVGCKYCKYRDICYMKNDDIVNLKEYKDLDFLGGDINA